MSIDMPEREQAAKIRQGLAEKIEAIRAHKQLTPKGRKARIAMDFVDAQAEMQRLALAE
jgi:hypothetical protein